MSTSVSRLPEIIDATARIALLEIPTIRSARGAGSGLIVDPRTGNPIEAAPSNPTEDFQHWSDLPEAGDLPLNAMQGTHVVTWTVPMKLFVGKGRGLAEARRALAPFMPAYIGAFAKHVTLEGTARRWFGMTFRIAADDTWAWLEIRLRVDERLNLATEA